jgi:hypothetical protein
MVKMTEEEADRLDEYYTNNLPELDFNKPGIFAQQKDTVVVLDSFTSKYLISKGLVTKQSPSEIISDMVRHEMEAAS